MDNETDAENQKSTTSPSSEPPVRSKAEFAVLNAVLIALEDVEKNEDRERVLLAAAAFFGIHLGGRASQAAPSIAVQTSATRQQPSYGAFSEDRPISPKDFLIQKQPRIVFERLNNAS